MSRLQPSAKKIRRDSMDDDIRGLPTSQELMEMCSSPDPFAESPNSRNVSLVGGGDINEESLAKSMEDSDELQEVLTSSQPGESPSSDNSDLGGGESSSINNEDEFIPWRGCPLSELQKGTSRFGMPQMNPIKPSSYHTVMFQMPGNKDFPPTPIDAWDSNHVRLPCSPNNLYPVGDSVKSRWEMVKCALEKPITNSKELENAIMSYNRKYMNRWNFSGLHEFFEEVIEEEERKCFFSDLLPQMVQLALLLPTLISRPLPLLREHQNRSISLTQHQTGSLLANAFFCTFPRRNASKQASEYSSFPDINFNRLFQDQKKKVYKRRTHEKLKCLFHYFRRVCHKTPTGTITFTRQYVTPSHLPTWEYSSHYFRKLHVASKGTIEDYGKGMLQVDFAHKMVGGGVLGWGCVQEEIRFVICPELIVARLFTECLGPTEALLVTGAEQYSSYEGYADTFMWDGDYQDDTPRDSSGRMLCTIVAMDALFLRNHLHQYHVDNIIREANKAYAGFFNMEVSNDNLSAVATGNWGCGVYRGNAQLKALIQLLAAAQTGRSVAYFTFGNIQLRDNLAKLHKFLVDNRATVGLVWRHMCQYYEQCHRNGSFVMDLYDFIHKSMDPSYPVKLSPVKGRKALILPRKKINISPNKSSLDKKETVNQDGKRKIFPVFNVQKTCGIKNQSIPLLKKTNVVSSKESETSKGKVVPPKVDSPNSLITPHSFSNQKNPAIDTKVNPKRQPESPDSPITPHSSSNQKYLAIDTKASPKRPPESPDSPITPHSSSNQKNPATDTKASPKKPSSPAQSKPAPTSLANRINFSKKRTHSACLTKPAQTSSLVSLTSLPGDPKVLLIKSPAGKVVAAGDSRLPVDCTPYTFPLNEVSIPSSTPFSTPAAHPRVPLHIVTKKKMPCKFLENTEDNLSSWLDEYERKDLSTIQTRISDYFYEINIPK